MNREQNFLSDTDESDEDFQPDDVADESPISDDEAEDSEVSDGLVESTGEQKNKRPAKRKKTKSTSVNKLDDKDINTSRKSTRHRNNSQTNGEKITLEKCEIASDEEDKSRSNALWANFLNDVNSTSKCNKYLSKVEIEISSNNKEVSENLRVDSPTKKNLTKKVEQNIAVAEVVDFVDDEIKNKREMDVSSIKENKAAIIPAAKMQPFSRIMPGVGIKRTATTPATGSVNGLGSIINQLGKKKKVSVLEKSQMDWKCFKQSEGIDEQLKTFNKGKSGYLERQDFLQRTDLRQFEIEKNLRKSTRRPY